MSRKPRARRVVLAICPTSRGFGYAIFENVNSTLDWGRKTIHYDRNAQTLKRIRQLVDWYHPAALVLPDVTSRMGPHSERMEALFKAMTQLGKRRKLVVAVYSRADIRRAFAGIGAKTKYEIANAIAGQMPEFELWLPQKRKPWDDEDRRMCIFDAASLAFTFFHFMTTTR